MNRRPPQIPGQKWCSSHNGWANPQGGEKIVFDRGRRWRWRCENCKCHALKRGKAG